MAEQQHPSPEAALSQQLTDRIAQLRQLFPEAFSAGQLDWEQLRAAVNEAGSLHSEPYGLNWAGKREARQAAAQPARGILLACAAEHMPDQQAEAVTLDAAHLFIEGDNLEVLRLLVDSYAGQVRMIYIDPPYNTGNDFIYADDYTDPLATYLRCSGQADAQGRPLTATPETSGRYHSAWLSMLYPRLILARQLLRADGIICVSIGDRELANLRLLMNEIFGEENYRNTILVRCHDKNINRQFIERGLQSLNVGAEYVLVYARSAATVLNPVYREPSLRRQQRGYWKGFWNAADRPTMRYNLLGVTPQSGQWKWQREVAEAAVRNYQEYLEHFAATLSLEAYWEQTGRQKRFIRRNLVGRGKNAGVEHWVPPSSGILRSSNWTDLLACDSLDEPDLPFDSPKNVALLKELIRMGCSSDGLLLDFFAGSCTTAQAVLELNAEEGGKRRFIMVQHAEATHDPHFPTIAAIGKERIRRTLRRLWNAESAGPMLSLQIYKLLESE